MAERKIHVEQHGPDAAPFDGRLRVVTWNIQFGVEAEAAAEALVEHDELSSADIVLLQEMDEAGTTTVARAIGHHSAYAAASVHPKTGRNFGNAVLTPHRLEDPHILALPHKSMFQGTYRLALGARIVIGRSVVHVASVHTEVPSLSAPKRMRQFEELAAAAAGWPGARMVIGGDFNTMTKRGIEALTLRMEAAGASRVSAGSGPTLRRAGQRFTLDHVFARGLLPLAAGAVHGLDASDHAPVWVDLAVDPAAATRPPSTGVIVEGDYSARVTDTDPSPS